jgi:hypothetical protein
MCTHTRTPPPALRVTPLCGTIHPSTAAQVKMHWVHTQYWKLGPEGNDIHKTNVPALRMRFRCGGGPAHARLCQADGLSQASWV